MQRIRDWFAKKNDSAKVVPPQDVEDVLQDYEEALLKLASLVHPCDEPYLALQACGGSADAEDLQNKVGTLLTPLIFSVPHNSPTCQLVNTYNINNSSLFTCLVPSTKKNSTNALQVLPQVNV